MIKKTTETLTYIVILLLVALVIGLSIWNDLSLWHECRADHSFLYCSRVLGHR